MNKNQKQGQKGQGQRKNRVTTIDNLRAAFGSKKKLEETTAEIPVAKIVEMIPRLCENKVYIGAPDQTVISHANFVKVAAQLGLPKTHPISEYAASFKSKGRGKVSFANQIADKDLDKIVKGAKTLADAVEAIAKAGVVTSEAALTRYIKASIADETIAPDSPLAKLLPVGRPQFAKQIVGKDLAKIVDGAKTLTEAISNLGKIGVVVSEPNLTRYIKAGIADETIAPDSPLAKLLPMTNRADIITKIVAAHDLKNANEEAVMKFAAGKMREATSVNQAYLFLMTGAKNASVTVSPIAVRDLIADLDKKGMLDEGTPIYQTAYFKKGRKAVTA